MNRKELLSMCKKPNRKRTYLSAAIKMEIIIYITVVLVGGIFYSVVYAAGKVMLDGPSSVKQYDVAEYTLRPEKPAIKGNPFTDVNVSALFTPSSGKSLKVDGFCDAQDGSIFKLRFCPHIANITYKYAIHYHDMASGVEEKFSGELWVQPSDNPGPVIVDPEHPKHFIRAGSRKPFYHLGYTAYHLLDISNDDRQVRATIDYCVEYGFNKIRFLLTGYPRDTDKRKRQDPDHNDRDQWKLPNYGAPPGEVNPLPAWEGKPHQYDFTRFNVKYWQKVERAIRYMRKYGIVATCIFTIEKQNLPNEYGALTNHEYRLYRYAIARLAAFDNVWWDLGNEHNEYRDKAWGDTMGAFVKAHDPYHRLASAHAYADFLYSDSQWADFIITQQYGDESEVNGWALKYWKVPKPYVNEEYGYERLNDKPGHGQNANWVRRCHWAIAMAGGYATYGDWHNTNFYTGEPGKGKAPRQLKLLRSFFESLPLREMEPHNELVNIGFCLAKLDKLYAVYLPHGGKVKLALKDDTAIHVKWFNPRTGEYAEVVEAARAKTFTAPDDNDWTLLIRRR